MTKDKKSDSTRNRILLEAGPIFAVKGFRGTTVREICDSAKVNIASINYYFGDKKQLYIETVVMARQMRVKQIPYPEWEVSTPPEQKLADFIEMLLTRLVAMQSEPWQVRLLMREILQPTEACLHLVEEYFRPFFETLCGIVDDIVGQRLPAHQRSQIGFSIIGQCLYYRFSADVTAMMVSEPEFASHFDRATLANHISEFSLGAIKQLKQKLVEKTHTHTSSVSKK